MAQRIGCSQVQTLGPLAELITQIIGGVEGYLKKADLEIEPVKKGRLIALMYEHFSKTGEEPDQKTIVSYLKLVA